MDGLNGYNRASSLYGNMRAGSEPVVNNPILGDRPSRKENENGVSVDDFLNLMVAQLRNQDFMNPVDDTQYVTQLAQFATMQQMQNMAHYMQTNYVMSYVGKYVTAAQIGPKGELIKETGRVDRLSLVNNEFHVYVNGKRFTLEQIMEIHSEPENNTAKPDAQNNSQMSLLLSLINKEVTVKFENKETGKTEEVTGIVERISTEDGKNRVMIGDKWYNLSDVTAVGSERDDSVSPPDAQKPDTDNPETQKPETDPTDAPQIDVKPDSKAVKEI